MLDGDLDIPESNREIALHLRAIRSEVSNINSRMDDLDTNINSRMDHLESRRFRLQDILLSALLLPLVGGMILFLLTKALG